MRLIDADITYEVLADYYHHRLEEQHRALKDALNRVPTVEAEPIRHGRWLTNIHRRTVCSECGFRPETETNYCPSCGAKMDVNQIVNQTVNQVSTNL